MEQEAPRTNHDIPRECDQEYCVVAMLPDVQHSLDTKIEEQRVCQRIHKLGDVCGGIVVLRRALLAFASSSSFHRSFIVNPNSPARTS